MEQHYTLSDAAFEKEYKNGTFDPAFFSHEAHLRLAWIHIMKYGDQAAIQNICTQLMKFVELNGITEKYNETLTIASIKAVYHFTQKSGAGNFQDFIAAFPQLKYNFKDLIQVHYSVDIFNSERAKRAFIEPDLLPFA